MEIPSRIKVQNFPIDQYLVKETKKSQIVLHFTAGGSAQSSIDGWKATPERVATPVVVDRDGSMLQIYSSKYMAYHLALKNRVFQKFGLPFQWLDEITIPIEIANYGRCTRHPDGNIYNAYGTKMDPSKIITYDKPFRGNCSFEKMTTDQIESVRQLLLYWGEKWNIPLTYNPGMFDLSKDALSGKPGVYTHVCYNEEKQDWHPQPDLVDMLKGLHK